MGIVCGGCVDTGGVGFDRRNAAADAAVDARGREADAGPHPDAVALDAARPVDTGGPAPADGSTSADGAVEMDGRAPDGGGGAPGHRIRNGHIVYVGEGPSESAAGRSRGRIGPSTWMTDGRWRLRLSGEPR